MQLVATLAVVVSVLVLAYQGRELAGHTRVANEVAGTEAHRELMSHWKSILDVFIQHPELHAYYFGQTTASPGESDCVRLKVIAEQHGDWLEAGLVSNEQLKSYTHLGVSIGEWTDYAAEVFASSPVLRSSVRANPGANPPLDLLLADYDAAQRERANSPTVPPMPASDPPATSGH
jgi:hypothetical protein